MIVVRYTWHVEANFAEVRKLFMEITMPEVSALRGGRGYQAKTGLDRTLALEWEFDSLADWEKFVPQFWGNPANADKFRRWNELTNAAATIEVWELLRSG